MTVGLVDAHIIGLFLEAFTAGIFVTLACLALFTQYCGTGFVKPRGYALPIISTMIVLVLSHLIITFVNTLEGVREHHIDPWWWLVGTGNRLFGAGVVLCSLQTLLGDSILIWRCYVLYSPRIGVVVFPLLCLLGCVATFIGEVYAWFTSAITGPDSTQTWVTCYLALTLFQNIYTTVAIMLWCFSNATSSNRGLGLGWKTVLPVFIVMAESGALYSLWALASLVMHVTESNGQLVSINSQPPVIGIIYCLILLQIRYHISAAAIPNGNRDGVNATMLTSHGTRSQLQGGTSEMTVGLDHSFRKPRLEHPIPVILPTTPNFKPLPLPIPISVPAKLANLIELTFSSSSQTGPARFEP